MATTTYVVLQMHDADSALGEGVVSYQIIEESLSANNAEHARRRAAERLPEEEVDGGVTLVAVPARNWKAGSGRVKAQTERRIRPA